MFKLVSKARNFIWNKFVQWLICDRQTDHIPLSDFDRLRYELRPDDVLLNAGQPTKTLSSSVIAEAFACSHFPIRSVLHQNTDSTLNL